MATFLDVGLLAYFDVIYAVLLVFALVFAALQKTKVIGDSLAVNSIIAVVAGILVALSRDVVEIINFMIPWFVIAIIFFVLIILIFQIFGLKETDLAAAAKDKAVYWTILGIAIVIFVAAGATVFGQRFVEAGDSTGEINATDGGVATGSFEANIYATLFHPKILAMLVLFGVAIFAIALLSG